jgi:CDGSH-type Zn-finger protein
MKRAEKRRAPLCEAGSRALPATVPDRFSNLRWLACLLLYYLTGVPEAHGPELLTNYLNQPTQEQATVMADPITIRCRENGPLVVQGPLKITDHLGNEFHIPPGKDVVALCRCGQSKNKPFCDGSHRTCGFLAAELGQAAGAGQ